MDIPKPVNSLSRRSQSRPHRAGLCKFILTYVHFRRNQFNFSFFSLQKKAERKRRPEYPVQTGWRGGFEQTVLRKSLFQGAIKPLSEHDIGFITTRKSPFHNLKWALLQDGIISIEIWYSINRWLSIYYEKCGFSRFFGRNGSWFAPERFFRGFRRDYLTSPAPFFVFLYFGTRRLHVGE